ncbi:mucin-2-like [Phlebotomus argentipes]|uniref:mucin-2-like n=1 Tax=Phlebotomus argentipes TaxID=94469 RepID=UPI002892B153|nr:mucin-2-like [Phlebotomus argentipes]
MTEVFAIKSLLGGVVSRDIGQESDALPHLHLPSRDRCHMIAAVEEEHPNAPAILLLFVSVRSNCAPERDDASASHLTLGGGKLELRSSTGCTAVQCDSNIFSVKMNEATQRGGRSQWRQWSRSSLWTILILTSMATCHSSPVYLKNSHHLSHYQSGRNIRHLPCKIRRSGEEGICMFAIDCLKSNGTHLGTCIDRFYFGSCCHIKDDQLLVEPEISDNSIDENTISHFLHQQTRPTGGTLKPSTEGETPERTERPLIPVSTISATTSHNLSSESSVPALHHHYTTNYDVISLSSSSPSPPSSSSATTTPSPVPSSLATEPSTSSAPLEETRFTSSTPAATTTPENVKLSTFQSVEDVTKAPVEEVTTPRVTTTTHSTRYPTRRTTTQQPTTTSTTVKSTHSPKPKPKPTNVKRPSSTKKPPASPSSRPKPTRRPTTPVANATTITKKPTRKPTTESTTLAAIIPTRKKTTTTTPSTTTLPTTLSTTTTESTTKKVITTTTVQTTAKPTTVTTVKSTPGTDEEEKPLTTLSFVETTKAPRPKPKPTSSIAIVPPSTIAVEEVEIQSSTSGVESPVTQSEVLSTSTSTSTLTSTSAAVENATKAETTTMASGLVTWTNNIDESERNKTESTTEGWIPLQTIPVESSSEATPAAITEAINATTAEDTTASSTTGVTIGNATEQTSAQTTAGDVAQNGTTETTTPMMEGIDYRLSKFRSKSRRKIRSQLVTGGLGIRVEKISRNTLKIGLCID